MSLPRTKQGVSYSGPAENPVLPLYEMLGLPQSLQPYQLYLSLPPFQLAEVPKRSTKRLVQISETRVYSGQVRKKEPDGAGVSVSSDGAIFEGNFQAGKMHGKGRLLDAQGTTLEGEWVEGVMQGFGRIQHAAGVLYVGNIFKGIPNGEGKETWDDGGYFAGNFHEGKKHGYGVFQWSSKNRYSGQFIDSVIEGRGKYEWADGRVYEGEWHNEEMHGNGTHTWPDGRRYVGEFTAGKRQGWGTMYEKEGTYTGQWHSSMKHGMGKYTYHDGRVVTGIWSENELQKTFEDTSGLKSTEERKSDSCEGGETPVLGREGNRQATEMREFGDRRELQPIAAESPKANSVDGSQSDGDAKNSLDIHRGSRPAPSPSLFSLDEGSRISLLQSIDFPPSISLSSFVSPAALCTRQSLGAFVYPSLFSEGKAFTEAQVVDERSLFRGEVDERGVRSGRGVCLQDGEVWEGLWEDDKMEGLGRRIAADGSVHVGYWRDSQPHGFGVYRDLPRYFYAGEWVQGQHSGFGYESTPEFTYSGQFENGYKHGHGRLELPNEGVYDGMFQTNRRQGYGTMTPLEGMKYASEWENDHAIGKCVYQRPGAFQTELSNSLLDKKEFESSFSARKKLELSLPQRKPVVSPRAVKPSGSPFAYRKSSHSSSDEDGQEPSQGVGRVSSSQI